MVNRFYYEFFAGGGMARLGLGSGWKCLMANDIDPKKLAIYRANFGEDRTILGDVYDLKSEDMPGHPDLAWASFPCQDLSLAGNRAGLAGERSGAFWGFWQAINLLRAENRQPKLLVLENVTGTLSSHGRADFVELAQAIVSLGYDFGALVVDAIHFLPQSRPRLFIICSLRTASPPRHIVSDGPVLPWHSPALCKAHNALPAHLQCAWRWWKLPPPPERTVSLANLLEADEEIASWHSAGETARLLGMMSPTNAEKVRAARLAGRRVAGTVYKRTRAEEGLGRMQRAEARFDGVAGCLRTPGGGSSRQTVIIVDGKQTRSRLLTVREAARLMGVPDGYVIPENYNDGYHVFGDGLAVTAVGYIRQHILNALCKAADPAMSIAAE
ncbi:MAG: DNA cytosine methyltransferase [Aestuariivirga sp.]|uniref:DNA cytosine methyltransferase n=1 Tax=Aestuariivirga sp. TaxID=2650926 RepID=UPI0025C1D3E3|nr:DNA cytosine methyltransferase [Aestuariivirga sp.]MCA3562426.1 DNA cytosine methyltransferase [Aestuariivirga sp.]